MLPACLASPFFPSDEVGGGVEDGEDDGYRGCRCLLGDPTRGGPLDERGLRLCLGEVLAGDVTLD